MKFSTCHRLSDSSGAKHHLRVSTSFPYVHSIGRVLKHFRFVRTDREMLHGSTKYEFISD